MILALVVEHYFKSPSWHGWMKFFEIDWNCNLLLMTFLMSLPIVLSNMMSLNALEELYNSLLGLEIIMDVETLEYVGQWPSSKYASVILIIFLKHLLSLIILLKCLHDNLSGLGVDELLYLLMELMNSASENSFQVVIHFLRISSKRLVLI